MLNGRQGVDVYALDNEVYQFMLEHSLSMEVGDQERDIEALWIHRFESKPDQRATLGIITERTK